MAPIDSNAAPENAPNVPSVDVATVASKEITEWQDYSGRLEAVDYVQVRALVPGTIVAVHFKDGANVKKGDPLFTIDPRPYEAEVQRAGARVAAARARATYTSDDAARAGRALLNNQSGAMMMAIGEGKVQAVTKYCAMLGVPPSRCIAYGDHSSDVPMLSAVGRAVVVDPDTALAARAREQGWDALSSGVALPHPNQSERKPC